jgi:hypothetical protein
MFRCSNDSAYSVSVCRSSPSLYPPDLAPRETWRSNFYLLTGLTVLSMIIGYFTIDPDHPSEEVDKRVDWIGGALITIGLVLIIYVLSAGEIAERGWATPC